MSMCCWPTVASSERHITTPDPDNKKRLLIQQPRISSANNNEVSHNGQIQNRKWYTTPGRSLDG